MIYLIHILSIAGPVCSLLSAFRNFSTLIKKIYLLLIGNQQILVLLENLSGLRVWSILVTVSKLGNGLILYIKHDKITLSYMFAWCRLF